MLTYACLLGTKQLAVAVRAWEPLITAAQLVTYALTHAHASTQQQVWLLHVIWATARQLWPDARQLAPQQLLCSCQHHVRSTARRRFVWPATDKLSSFCMNTSDALLSCTSVRVQRCHMTVVHPQRLEGSAWTILSSFLPSTDPNSPIKAL